VNWVVLTQVGFNDALSFMMTTMNFQVSYQESCVDQ